MLRASAGRLTVNNLAQNLNTAVTENAGTLDLNGNWSNLATLSVDGGTLNLGGTFTLAGLGTLNRSGGTVNLVGTLDNTATTLALTAATGSWNLLGGTLKGGSLSGSGGAQLVMATNNSGTLDGVTVTATGNLNLSANSASVTVLNGLVLNGTANVGSGANPAWIDFNGSQTLSGTGSVLFGNSSVNALRLTTAGTTLTIGSGITVHGHSGAVGYSANIGGPSNVALVNQGTIAADVAGGTITLTGTNGVTNAATGMLRASGGTLAVSSLGANSGLISVGAGSIVAITGGFTNAATGTVSTDIGGTLTTQFGRISVTGAATLNGTLVAQLVNGFTPAIGNAFQLMTYASVSGTFSTISGGTVTYTPTYGVTSLTITVVAPFAAAASEATADPGSETQTFGTQVASTWAAANEALRNGARTRAVDLLLRRWGS